MEMKAAVFSQTALVAVATHRQGTYRWLILRHSPLFSFYPQKRHKCAGRLSGAFITNKSVVYWKITLASIHSKQVWTHRFCFCIFFPWTSALSDFYIKFPSFSLSPSFPLPRHHLSSLPPSVSSLLEFWCQGIW